MLSDGKLVAANKENHENDLLDEAILVRPNSLVQSLSHGWWD